MRLSKLQTYIITTAYLNQQPSCLKKEFYHFYSGQEIKEHTKIVHDTIHKSLDNLVEKELLAAYGHKTARKWFIQRVKLTPGGRNQAKYLLKKKQQKMRLK